MVQFLQLQATADIGGCQWHFPQLLAQGRAIPLQIPVRRVMGATRLKVTQIKAAVQFVVARLSMSKF